MEPQSKSDRLTERARRRLGDRVRDKWLLEELLGVGGMAAVYAATHRNGKRVAIKVLHPEVAASDDTRNRFLREGYVANAVEHDGAVSVLDEDVTEDGAPFFVMDLFEGETLDQRLRRSGPLDVSDVLAAADALLDVLAAAHKKKIVHRDIKPDNVFLTKDGHIKVLDFGIAQLRETGHSSTQVGHTMGTPSFMSPEQARGRWDEVDAQSDLWAVGATMYTLLTGRHVHEADTMNEVLLGAMTRHAGSLALACPGLSPDVCRIVDRALRFEKADRWESASAMQEAIRAVRDLVPPSRAVASATTAPSFALPPLSGASASEARPERSRSRTLFGAGTAIVLALAVWAVVAHNLEQAHVDASIAAQPSAPPLAPLAPLSPPTLPVAAVPTTLGLELPDAREPATEVAASNALPPAASAAPAPSAPSRAPPSRPPHATRRPPAAPASAAPSSSANLLDRRH
jgi:serine/threonine protein kinase